jgi:ribose 5-phosphate isomerase A
LFTQFMRHLNGLRRICQPQRLLSDDHSTGLIRFGNLRNWQDCATGDNLCVMNPKQLAAEAAIPFIRDGMVIGLGTGSTADFFLLALADALNTGKLKSIVGVPTSRQSEHRAQELGIPLTTLGKHPVLDLTVDGADEVAPTLDLIKGLGGALIREKIVAQNSKKFIVIADSGKSVPQLGAKVSLPVEVVPFAHETQPLFFKSIGSDPVLRRHAGMVFNTDNGNLIYDCKFPPMTDPAKIERQLLDRAGVVGCGLFLKMADVVLMADENKVTVMKRS